MVKVEITGKIKKLSSDNIKNGGYITIVSQVSNGNIEECRIKLDKTDYDKALYAHLNGKEIRLTVEVTGISFRNMNNCVLSVENEEIEKVKRWISEGICR